MLKTITSKEHYNEFKSIIKGVNEENLKNLVENLYKDVGELERKFKEDKHLNNIEMSLIDIKFYNIRELCIKNKTSWSLSDNVCTIKHILIYRILKVKPIFEENLKDFENLNKEWLEPINYKKYPNEDNFYRFRKII